MAAWFIRLGAKDEYYNWCLYQDLAINHSIIMIGYAINSTFTQRCWNFTKTRNRDQFEEYLKQCLKKRFPNTKFTPRQILWRAGLIDRFINRIQKNEMVISPHDRVRDYFRIGIIKTKCERVDSFFNSNQGILRKLINQHSKATQNPVGVKPARKIEWKYEGVHLKQLPNTLQQAMKNHRYMRPTTNELKINKISISGTIISTAGLKSCAVKGGLPIRYRIR